MNYLLTRTIIDFFKLPALKTTLALPTLLAVIVNLASPLGSVPALEGNIEIRFLSALLIFAVTVSPATIQSFSPFTVTVTSLLRFLLSVNLICDTEIELGKHSGAGDGDTVGVVGTVGINAKLS